MATYSVIEFIDDLRLITKDQKDDRVIIEKVIPLAKRLASETDWSSDSFRSCDESQGFGITILNEDEDNALMVETICWLPGRGVAPHDHQTWGVVVGIDGEETNVNWKRLDDGTQEGFADLTVEEEIIVGPAEACAFLPSDIHSVRNTGETPSLSLHVD